MKCWQFLYSLAWLQLVIHTSGAHAGPVEDLAQRDTSLWAPATLQCAVELPAEGEGVYSVCPEDKSMCFPGEGRPSPIGDKAICNDGDMTLFLALLCLAGYHEGCDGVSAAQNRVTGQWYRSPRLAAYPRLRTLNSSSPDMGLGTLLWAALEPKSRKQQLSWWIDWIARNQRCVTEGCQKRHPRFCPDDDVDGDPEAVKGCVFRPGDLATLAFAVDKLKINVRDKNLRRALSAWKKTQEAWLNANPVVNWKGYSTHLIAVNILVLWKLGVSYPSLDKAAEALAKDNDQNAFFAWLANKPADVVSKLALAKCPASEKELPPKNSREDWIWQRGDESDANKKTMLWDCRFVAGLIKNNVSRKGSVK